MLKTGISEVKGLAKRSLFKRPRLASLALLRRAEAFEKILLDLRLSDGIYRTTSRHRFAALNPRVNALLGEHFSHSKPLLVHDWAVSDGSAALQWARELRACFSRLTFVASDKTLFLVEAFQREGESYFLEETGAPLQYARAPFVISLQRPESLYYPVNRWIAKRARRTAASLRETVASLRWPSDSTATVRTSNGWRFARISLIHPEVRRFADAERWFRVQAHSVFEPLPAPAHVIRSLNIFNFIYFPEEQLLNGFRAVHASLAEGGLWISGKSLDAEGRRTNVTVFVKERDGFTVRERIGEGAETERLVLGFRP